MKTALHLLQEKLSTLCGYHFLVMGDYFNAEILTKPGLHTFGLSPALSLKKNQSPAWVQAAYEHLPFRENSIDAAVVPYLTECVQNPLDLFGELHRCLIGEGKLFIFGHERVHPRYWFHRQSSVGFSMKRCLEVAQFTVLNMTHFAWGQHYFIEAQKKVRGLTPIQPQWALPVFEKTLGTPAARKTSE
jgi:SAM-dependent methyltransferase